MSEPLTGRRMPRLGAEAAQRQRYDGRRR